MSGFGRKCYSPKCKRNTAVCPWLKHQGLYGKNQGTQETTDGESRFLPKTVVHLIYFILFIFISALSDAWQLKFLNINRNCYI